MKFMVYVDVWFYALSPVNWSLDFMASHQESWQINISTHPRLNIDSHTHSILSTQRVCDIMRFPHCTSIQKKLQHYFWSAEVPVFGAVALSCPVVPCPTMAWPGPGSGLEFVQHPVLSTLLSLQWQKRTNLLLHSCKVNFIGIE